MVTEANAAVSSSESFMMISDMLEGDSDRFDCDMYFMCIRSLVLVDEK